MLVVSVPDFAILNVATDAIKQEFEQGCPDCTLQSLDLSIADLTGGTVSSQIVSALQSDPDIGYVYVTFGDLAGGLPEALSSAGLDDVKLLGHVPNPEQLQSLADGTSFAWIPLPRPESGWAAVDAMVRLAAGQEIDQAQHEVLPIEIWTHGQRADAGRGVRGPGRLPGPVQGAVGSRRGDRRLDDRPPRRPEPHVRVSRRYGAGTPDSIRTEGDDD